MPPGTGAGLRQSLQRRVRAEREEKGKGLVERRKGKQGEQEGTGKEKQNMKLLSHLTIMK